MTRYIDSRPVQRIDCDLVVVGGGAAGVATATVAARNGLSVVLVEKYGFCGGGAVAGHSGTICGLFEATDNADAVPNQVVFGFADEYVKLLESRNGLGPPVQYGKTYTRVHDPLVWREASDHLLKTAGVTVIYHSVAIQTLLDGGEALEGVRLWSKEGPLDVFAKITVDASGDADLVAMAGLPNFIGDNGRVQNPTMIFRLLNVNTDTIEKVYGTDTIMPAQVSELIAKANCSGKYTLPRAKIWLFKTTRKNELLCNCTRIIGEDGRELNPLLWRDFSEAEMQGRLQAREYANFFKEYLKGCENTVMNDTAVQVGVRQTRQIEGVSKLKNSHIIEGKKCKDGIAMSPWPVELHAGKKPRVEWLLNDAYEIPYGCFVPARGENLLTAGRCLSAEHEAVASARVTAQCFGYGHAIGHAAALAVKENIAARDIHGADIRMILNKENAQLNGGWS